MSWGVIGSWLIKAVLIYLCYTFGGALLLGVPLSIYLFVSREKEE